MPAAANLAAFDLRLCFLEMRRAGVRGATNPTENLPGEGSRRAGNVCFRMKEQDA